MIASLLVALGLSVRAIRRFDADAPEMLSNTVR